MNKLNNARALALGRGLTVLISLMLLPYLSRSLPVETYGSYGQVLFYTELFKALALLGLNKVIFIYLSKTKKVDEVYSNNIFISFVAGCFLAIICAFSSIIIANVFDNQSLILPICIYSFTIPFDTCYQCYSSILVNESKSKLLTIIAVISNILRAAVLLIIIQNVVSLIYIFVGLTIVSVIQFLLIIYLSKIFVTLKHISINAWLPQIKEGFPLGLTSIIGTLYYLTDSFVVSSILSNHEYAILRNGAFQIPFISTIYSIIGLVLMKDLSQYVIKKDYTSIISLKSRAIILSMIIIFPVTIFLIVFAKYWIPFLFSAAYKGSVLVFMIYNIITLFRITSYENLIVLSENGNRLPSIYLISFFLNLLLSIPLTYLYGPSGSAIASLISFLFLISFLTKMNLAFLNASVKDFISSKQLFTILIPSLSLSIVPFVLLNYSIQSLPSWTAVLIIGLLLGLVYHIILKSRIISDVDLRSVIKLIPISRIQKLLISQYCA